MSVAGSIFKPARLRLTITYLAVIMTLTLGFSVVFYQQSVSEAKGNLESQRKLLDEFLFFTTPDGVRKIRDAQLRNFKQNLVKDLVALNVGMLAVGALVSAVLARRSLRPLEETIEAQTRFTSDAAHELRTPLTAMKTEIEVSLRDKSLTKAESVDVLKSNLEEVNKLESLTNALLRLAKSGESVDRSNWQDYRISEVLNKSFSRLAAKAEKRQILVKLPSTKATVHGDPDQLVELFVTLLGNAIKYSHEKSDVTVKVKSHDDTVEVTVSDNGIGISKEDMPHIFERFYRADVSRNKTKADGYGLGLSLAKAIVDAHKGKITVNSTVEKGTSVSVLLPN